MEVQNELILNLQFPVTIYFKIGALMVVEAILLSINLILQMETTFSKRISTPQDGEFQLMPKHC